MAKEISKEVSFSAEKNSIDLLYDDDRFCVVSVDLLHEDEEGECNRNMCNISHEANLQSIDSIYNTTISCRYNSICKDFVTDVVEHFADDKERFETRIVGHFPPDARIKFVKRENGKTYLNVEGIIQKKLVPEFMEILKNSDNDLKVSTVLRCRGHQDDDTGIFYIDKWILQTTTVLSDTIKEGIEGAHLEVVGEPDETQISNANEIYMQFAYKDKRKDIFEEIKNKQEKEIRNVSLGIRELEARLWECLKKFEYSDGGWRGHRYWIVNVLTDTKEVVVHDNQTDELFKIPYKVNKDGDVSVKEEERKKVVEDKNYREVANSEWTFAKEDYGTGETITVDKGKDSVSDKEWGKVSKTALRNKVLEAKNYKELVKEVYLVVEEGWEDAPSEKLKYPVMELVGGKAVYNREALASALGYAKANDEEEVVKKVEKIYKDLGLVGEEEKKNADEGEEKKPVEEGHEDHEDDKGDEEKEVENSEIIDIEKMKKEWEKKYNKLQNACDEWKNKCGDWENKYSELEKEFESLSEKVKIFQDKEDKEEMTAYLKAYRKSFGADEYEVMASKIKEMSKDEFVKEVDNKVKEFVRKMAEQEEEEKEEEKEFSFIPFPNARKEEKKASATIDEVLEKLNK